MAIFDSMKSFADYAHMKSQYDRGIPIGSLDDASFLDALDNIFTGNLDYKREKHLMHSANAFSASQAQINREFQERLSNSAYTRAVADLKRAGFNPALAYQQGGASTPSGSSAHSVSASAGKSGQGFANILSLLLGSAFKVATTSMMGEARAVSDLTRANSAMSIARERNNSAEFMNEQRELEKFRRDSAWRDWYDGRGVRR